MEHRWLVAAHEGTVRFHLALNTALAAAALALLKIEGPYFADAIAAGLFTCGFALCIFSLRAIRHSSAEVASAAQARAAQETKAGLREADAPPYVSRSRGVGMVLWCLAVFNLASASVTIWLTYISPVETAGPGLDTLAVIFLALTC